MRWAAPRARARIAFDAGGSWACVSGCGFARPEPMATLRASGDGATYQAVWSDGACQKIALALPGRFNYANALMAAVAAAALGVDAVDGLAAMATVGDVAGRFTVREVGGVRARLMLAKNPAGWSELLELVGDDEGPIVISINARTADGADPSWLWDVPFERLAAPCGGGDRGPVPRPVRAAALCRGDPRDGGRPGGGRAHGGRGRRRPPRGPASMSMGPASMLTGPASVSTGTASMSSATTRRSTISSPRACRTMSVGP